MAVASRTRREEDGATRGLERHLRTALIAILGFFLLYFLTLFVLTR